MQLALTSDIAVTIAAAGAIPPLVQLLGSDSPADVQKSAAAALKALGDSNSVNRAAIAAAGANANLLQEMRGLGIDSMSDCPDDVPA
ncbi:hypothetical protein FOA52_008841 [Chlamydomonas sp. UWO 241]|nr:hypothetical protein FOA52_008841 [Chlamydomonas sp. UWO 241]